MEAEEQLKFINAVVEKIGCGNEVVLVPVVVEDYSIEANCFYNVPEKIKRDGGSIVYGWSIFFGFNICEAERHAVWKSPSGELLDITQNTSNLTVTTFLPEELDYYGQLIDNVRVNITSNKFVDYWIQICEIKGKIHDVAIQTRVGDKTKVEVKEPELIKLYNKYDELANIYYTLIFYKATESSNCYCNKGKSYKKCHGLNFKLECKKDLETIKKYQ